MASIAGQGGRSLTRRLQSAEALRALGYSVESPESGDVEERIHKLTGW